MEANNPLIQKRTVTVKVITIGEKQVTQALYKQLVVKNVIDPRTGKLQGNIWGWVNLHGEHLMGHKNCEQNNDHFHVIWEENGILKRCIVCRQQDNSGYLVPDAIKEEWLRSYLTIRDAGQLFIAVSGVWK